MQHRQARDATKSPRFRTRASLRADLGRLGLEPGNLVMVHAAMSRLGRLLNGPDAFIGALRDAVGPEGTIMAYVDWDGDHDELLDETGHVAAEWRPHLPPFDPGTSRANRSNGILAEFVRTTPGALRSGNPGASVAAIGAKGDWLTRDHPLDYGYGPDSPLARLVSAGGKVIMAGAPLERMTLLHHAEHLARIPGKRMRRSEVPLVTPSGVEWRTFEEYETSKPVLRGLPDDYFGTIVREYLDAGFGRQGLVGDAPSLLVDAGHICRFAVKWLERTALEKVASDTGLAGGG